MEFEGNHKLQEEVLNLLAAGKIGLATDVDGTLSPIAETPAGAIVPARCRATLQTLAQSGRFAVVAVISGRMAEEACEMVKVPELLYLGNHGMELLRPGNSAAEPVKAAVPYQPFIASVLETVRHKLVTPGDKEGWQQNILFENKGVTASIHYRRCPDPDFARQQILQTVQESLGSSGLKISEGRMVIELRPPVAINKGTAMLDLADLFSLQSLIFLGDDLTDVDGFRALHLLEKDRASHSPGFRGVGIGVYNAEMSPLLAENADYLVDGVTGVGDFLEWLAKTVSSAA